MASKPVGGFDLILGQLYNDGWFNRLPIQHNTVICCAKCRGALSIHELQKAIVAFGKLIIKNCTVTTCPVCLDEVLRQTATSTIKRATKPNLVKLFSTLPKEVQEALINGK